MATILVADDLTANREVLVTLLRHHGHRLVEAVDGRDALEAVRRDPPDLVITDVLMPVMDGYEFVRQLRLDPATRDIPVVFYTAHYGEREARDLALASGVSFVLTKPAESAETLRIVSLALAGQAGPGNGGGDALSGDFDREHLRLLTDQLSEKAGVLRTANARLRGLVNIGLELASERDADRLLRSVCVAARDLFGATYVTLGILDRADRRVQRLFSEGSDVAWIATGERIPGALRTVVFERRTIRGDNPSGRPGDMQLPDTHPDVHTFLAAPVASPAHVYGWIFLGRNEGRPFTADDEHLVMALAGQVGRIYENSYFFALAESERDRAQRTEAQLRLQSAALNAAANAIVITDRAGTIEWVNPAFSALTGYAAEEAVGRNPRDLVKSDRHDTAFYRNMWDTILSGQVWSGEVVNRRKDGSVYTEEQVITPVRGAQGEISHFVAVKQDVTERRTLEQQYQQAQKMEAIGRLAGGVAHDFNNLLTVILGYSELWMAAADPDDPQRADIGEIHSAATRAEGLTRQLLAFSRKQIIEPTRLDLSAVVREIQKMLGRLIGEDVQVVTRLSPDLAPITADRGQIEQIVMNLAVNARDAMPTGGTLTIETANIELDEHYAATHAGVRPGQYVVLTVTDTGTGMTPEVQRQLFEPFFTTKEVGKGTGLGLATVHGIVLQSGGSVDVSSEVGSGTAFRIYLPRTEAAEAPDQPHAPAVRPRSETVTFLVVEDSDGLRQLVKRLLEKIGYKVLAAANGAEALILFDQHPSIDVLLTDVVMPGTSGPELTKQLIERRPGLKVIFMSGYTEEAIVRHGVVSAGVAFLHKPFTSGTLASKIRDVLDS